MLTHFYKLEFPQRRILFFGQVLPPIVILYSFGTFSRWPNWKDILWILYLSWIYVRPMLRGRTLITIDENGITWGRSRAFIPWSEVLACACKNDDKKRILRIFRRSTRVTLSALNSQARMPPSAQRRSTSANAPSEAENYLDMCFEEVEEPEQSLGKAFDACAATIASTRPPSETDNPIREFVEPPQAAHPEKNIKYWVTATRDFAIGFLVIPFLVLLIFDFLRP